MARQRRALIHLTCLLTAFVLFHSNAQGSKEASPIETLRFGEVTDRNVWPTGLSLSFEGKAGMVITLKVTSKTTAGGFDPFVRLIDPEEKEEASDDDSGGQGNCLIKDHALKKNGLYHVFIAGEDNKEGEVEVLLTKE